MHLCFVSPSNTRKELKGIKSSLNIRGIVLSFKIVCRFSTFLSLATYVYSGNVFTAHQVFIVTSYFNHLYLTMLHLWPIALTFVGEAYVSIRRIQSFLLLPEGKYHRAMTMSYGDEDANDVEAEAQTLMSNGADVNGKPANGVTNGRRNGSYGAINGCQHHKKAKKRTAARDLQLTQVPLYKRRIVNGHATDKGIVFDNVTAMWISDDNGPSIGE